MHHNETLNRTDKVVMEKDKGSEVRRKNGRGTASLLKTGPYS